MALIIPSRQRSDSYGTQHTKETSRTSKHRNKNSVQSSSKKENQDFDPQTTFKIILRTWPTWHGIDYLAQKAATIGNVNTKSSSGDLSPMERWSIETQQQSPWNAVADVTAVRKERYWEFEVSSEACSQFGDTDSGSWTPVFEIV